MTRFAARRHKITYSPTAVLATAAVGPKAPSGALINAILEHADVRQEIGGGCVVLRVSPEHPQRGRLRRLLGREVERLGDVALIWDEDAEYVVRVLDEAETARESSWVEDDLSELDTFELTEAALAYIAKYGDQYPEDARGDA